MASVSSRRRSGAAIDGRRGVDCGAVTKVFQISQKKKLGWIDASGKVLRQTKTKVAFHVVHYDGALDADCLYPVQIDGKWGFSRPLDPDPTIAPSFDAAGPFAGGIAAVGKLAGFGSKGLPVHHWALINERGDRLCDHTFAAVWPFLGDVALAQRIDPAQPLNANSDEARWGIIDRDGQFVVPPTWHAARQFRQERAAVCVDHKWGFVDSTGRVVVPLRYDTVSGGYREGIARVGVENRPAVTPPHPIEKGTMVIIPWFDGTMGLVDREGQILAEGLPAPPQHFNSDYHDFYDGLAMIEDRARLRGFIDRAGNVRIQPRFSRAWFFSEGMAAVESGGRYGFIATDGQWAIPPTFKMAWEFAEGLAAVQLQVSVMGEATGKKKKRLRWGFADRTGNLAIEARYAAVSRFRDGLALVLRDDDRWACVERGGREIWTES